MTSTTPTRTEIYLDRAEHVEVTAALIGGQHP